MTTPRWTAGREANASGWLFGQAEPGSALSATTRRHPRSVTVLAVTIALSLLCHSTVLLLLLVVLPDRAAFPTPSVEPSVALVFEAPPPATAPNVVPTLDAAAEQVEPSSGPAVAGPALPFSMAPPARPVDAPQPRRIAIARPVAPVRPQVRPGPPNPQGLTDPQAPTDLGANPAELPRAAGADVLIPPRPVAGMDTNRPPTYPQSAQRRGVEGSVMLRVGVSADGTPIEVEVLKTSGYSVLDQAAVLAVTQWRFVPATQAGRPIAAIAEVPIRFQLER